MNQALQEEFRAKTISAQQAAALVKSGQQVYLGCCTSYARAIADALAHPDCRGMLTAEAKKLGLL